MSIEATIDGFLSSDDPSAIIIRGKWGVGKTHFWRNRILSESAGKPWTQRYSYVSLFGINSLSELKVALGVATEEFNNYAMAEWRLKGSAIRWLWIAQRWLGDVIQLIPKVGDRAGKIYERASFYAVRNRVICFDDVERHGSSLSLRDMLGLVSYLVEDRRCRVVVILNDGQLSKDDQNIWNENREKVFHGELTYDPTLKDTIALGLAKDTNEPWYENLFLNLEELGVSNIRLVHRTSRSIRLAVHSVSGVELKLETIQHFAKVLPLLVYSTFGRGDGAPPMETVLRIGGQRRILDGFKKRNEVSAEEKNFEETVRRYGIYLHTALDTELIDMLRSGFPDSVRLSDAVSEFQLGSELRRLDDAWHSAWRTYHDTLQENHEEIVSALTASWPPVSSRQAAHNLQSLVGILRFFGEVELASGYIRNWIDQRRANGTHEFDERVIQSLSPIYDEEILGEIAAARVESVQPLSLVDAFDLWMTEDRLLRDDVISVFATATRDELVQLLRAVRNESMANGLRRILEIGGYPNKPDWQQATDNFRAALKEIAGDSALAARRIFTWVKIEP
ncbi:hypothetical protein [Xanthomonas campestris]|uniref:hypothetical protein n=1 Tax=Xanthomonas campestris TaxID=339 RepID=UPI0023E99502|nr:hypothetical protein [Xanthomonas campestris]